MSSVRNWHRAIIAVGEAADHLGDRAQVPSLRAGGTKSRSPLTASSFDEIDVLILA